MRAYEIQDKQGLDSLTRVERAEPTPGYGQVLLKMKAASLNYRDLLVAKGAYGAKNPRPIVPLSDGVGEVVAVGEGVTRVAIGDRVAGAFFPGWIDGQLSAQKSATALGGGSVDGMLADYVVLPETGVVPAPAYMTNEEVATLPCAAVTAWYSLYAGNVIKAGDTVLLLGTGGVSLFGLQLAKAAGAKIILTSSSDEKLERGKSLGADETINYRTTPDWDKAVFELTGREGVDYVIEVGGAGTLNKSLRSVRYGGQVSLIGVLTGTAGSDISTVSILHKNVRLQGVYVGSRSHFEAMNRALTLHQIHPVVDKVFDFEDARAAYDYMESGAHFGKIAIKF